jgi:hypothetical protein
MLQSPMKEVNVPIDIAADKFCIKHDNLFTQQLSVYKINKKLNNNKFF